MKPLPVLFPMEIFPNHFPEYFKTGQFESPWKENCDHQSCADGDVLDRLDQKPDPACGALTTRYSKGKSKGKRGNLLLSLPMGEIFIPFIPAAS